MNSALYEGWVRHRRTGPAPHAFRYRQFMLYLDLAELPTVFDGVPLWSARRPAPAWFRRADYLGDPGLPLDEAVRRRVQEVTGRRPAGPIRILTHLRYFGHCFNPVSFYYCWTPDDTAVDSIVAEITNTPWGERHAYVLRAEAAEGPRGVHRWGFAKAFHVSPFMPMELDYDWRFSTPGRRLAVHMENRQAGRKFFDATLVLDRRPLTPGRLTAALLRYPMMTARVVAAIHWQALRLWLKRVPFHPHPSTRTP